MTFDVEQFSRLALTAVGQRQGSADVLASISAIVDQLPATASRRAPDIPGAVSFGAYCEGKPRDGSEFSGSIVAGSNLSHSPAKTSSTPIAGPRLEKAARSNTFSSCRTFPGQSHPCNRNTAASER